jgi:hypothetical protein
MEQFFLPAASDLCSMVALDTGGVNSASEIGPD